MVDSLLLLTKNLTKKGLRENLVDKRIGCTSGGEDEIWQLDTFEHDKGEIVVCLCREGGKLR